LMKISAAESRSPQQVAVARLTAQPPWLRAVGADEPVHWVSPRTGCQGCNRLQALGVQGLSDCLLLPTAPWKLQPATDGALGVSVHLDRFVSCGYDASAVSLPVRGAAWSQKRCRVMHR
jgi:hypothetical protein